MSLFSFKTVHASWQECLERGLAKMDPSYLKLLAKEKNWLPGPEKIFNTFSLPLNQVKYVLFGESPYPRRESANGFAFWDAAVTEIWSPTGLSTKANRATSFRNLVKMLLLAEGYLNKDHLGQADIALLNKKSLIQSNNELFTNFLSHGFLLLNATLVLQARYPHKDAVAWVPFMRELLNCLIDKRPTVKFILLGRIAYKIDKLINSSHVGKLYAEHPYNCSFITNTEVINFFKPLHLIKKPINNPVT